PVDFALGDDQPEAVAEIDLDQVADDELVGRVIDIDGEPIAGVEVDVWTWFKGNETRTDKQGR
ncbi:MAG: hypothetical protein JSS02_31415, partial [Planctomycetes bacterium]|nr:hypothetical protein [Planctomycetota bacterium]